MKILYFLFPLFLLGCTNGSDRSETVDTRATLATQQAPESIRGVWTVSRYEYASVSAMDQATADEWVNRRLVIDTAVHFSFQKIPSYQTIFGNNTSCSLALDYEPVTVPASEFTDIQNAPMTALGIKDTNLTVYRTTCPDHPFSQFVLTENDELIIQWDGVYFVLTQR